MYDIHTFYISGIIAYQLKRGRPRNGDYGGLFCVGNTTVFFLGSCVASGNALLALCF